MFDHTSSEKAPARRHFHLKPPPGSRIVVERTADGSVRLSWTAPTLRGATLGCGIPFLGLWSLFTLTLAGLYGHLLLTAHLPWYAHLILIGLIGGMAAAVGFIARALIRLARADPESIALASDTLTHAPGIAADHVYGWHIPSPAAQAPGDEPLWQPRPGPKLPYTTASIPRAAVGEVRLCRIVGKGARTGLLVRVGNEYREFGYRLDPQDLLWLADVLRAWSEGAAGLGGRAAQ